MDLSQAQKELFIRCSWHSVCLYRAPGMLWGTTDSFLPESSVYRPTSKPRSSEQDKAPVWELTSKAHAQVDLMSGWTASGLRGRPQRDSPVLSPWRAGRQPGNGTALWIHTSKALGHCLTCCRQLSQIAEKRWRADDWGGQKQLTPICLSTEPGKDTGFKCGRVWSLAVHSKDPTAHSVFTSPMYGRDCHSYFSKEETEAYRR